jgi:hypothetical protein
MKSIKQQYIDLMEGRMSQHNFMRNVRMTLPQYVTNVTSFKDSVRILKNKGILSEAMGGDPIEATLKSYLAKGYSYAEAIKLTAAEQGMDEEVLMSQYPQDAVDTEGYEDDSEDDEFIDMIAKAEEEEAGKYTKNYDFPGGLGEGDDASEALKTVKEPNPNAGKYRITSIDGKMVIAKDFFDSMEAAQEYAKKNIRTSYKIVKLPAERSVYKKIDEGKKKKEPKKELHPNQIHPQELRMGIKVELEHTDSLDKAKKIALDHLAENPFYYTALKLAGVESPSTPKYKAPVAFKKEVTAAVELVDKINAMKPVKGVEKAKASSNKAKKETNSGVKGVEELTHNAKSVRGLQKFAATGGKMKAVREGQLNEGGEWTITGTLTKDEQTELKNMIGKYDLDVQATDDTLETTISHPMYNDKSLEQALKQVRGMLPKNPSFRPGVDLGKYDLKSLLEKMVREVLDEIYDGRDDMNAQYAQDEIK